MKNHLLYWLGAMIVAATWTSCDLFQPVSPDPSEKFVKLFGGRGDQTSATLRLQGDSTYFLLGTSSSFTDDGRNATYLVHADRAGNRIWQHTFASTDPETAIDMLLLDDAILLLSRLSANGGERILVRKLDLDGALIWERPLTLQADASYWPASLVTIPNSASFLIIGSETAANVTRIHTLEMDTTQQVKWQKTYNLLDRQSERGIAAVLHQGNLLILGESISQQGIKRPILIEADRNSVGEELQSKICFQDDLTLPNDLPALGLTPLSGDDFMILTQLGDEAAALPVRVLAQDRITPSTPLSSELDYVPAALTRTPEGDLLLLGHSATHLNLMRFDATMEPLWPEVRQYGYPSPRNRATMVEVHSDGSLAIMGTLDFFENTMMGLLKTLPDGLQ